MSNTIIKRNGTKMDFDGKKIYNAVAAAMQKSSRNMF